MSEANTRLNKILNQLTLESVNHLNCIPTTNKNKTCNILAYGDSCTWGYLPGNGERAEKADRWTTILETKLNNNKKYGKQYTVIAEGLNARTIKEDIPHIFGTDVVEMNGFQQFLPIIHSHKPIDIIIFMLGVNNIKQQFKPTSMSIAAQMYELAQLAIQSNAIWTDPNHKTIVIISPATVNEINEINKEWGFNQNSIEISRNLANEYMKIVVQLRGNCDKGTTIKFLDANAAGVMTGCDSVHFDVENNAKLAKAVYNVL
eukprot:25457_1